MDMKRTVDKVQKKLAEQVRKKEPPTPPPHQQEPQRQQQGLVHDDPASPTTVAAVNVSPSSTTITAPAAAVGHDGHSHFYDHHDDMELVDEDNSSNNNNNNNNNNKNNFAVEYANVPVAGVVVDPNPVVQDDAAVVAPDVHVNNNVIYDFDDLDMDNAEFLDDFFDSELVPVAGVVVDPNLVVHDDAAAAAPDVDDDSHFNVDFDDLDMAHADFLECPAGGGRRSQFDPHVQMGDDGHEYMDGPSNT
jgi:hypothetical protein